MNFKTPFTPLVILCICVIVNGCSSEALQKLKARPNAFGPSDKITVIADEQLWDSDVQDTISYYYGSAYIILPQPEPVFDIQHFTPEQLRNKDPRRQLRVYLVIADLEDEGSLGTKMVRNDLGEENYSKALADPTFNTQVARDRWALGQMVVYLWGRNKAELIENLKYNFQGIAKRVNKFDERQYEATIYFGGQNITAENAIQGALGVSLRVPEDYKLVLNDSTVSWLRRESNEASMNILVHRTKYTSQEQLTKEGLKKIRDDLGRQYISSTTPNTYMRVNDVDLPLFIDPMTLDNKYTIQGRGIWDIVNDYMGGAFVSYLIHDSEAGELVFIDGFVHAPGENKRLFMQQLNYILCTVKV
ncbi:MAG: DUF4837 family protein [Bacteroidia bacterium]|nr:DUF4837 family protein [Bacteroidia bacterium]